MNQRGEMNLIFVLMVVGLTSVLILCALKLQRSYYLLLRRSEFFLCMKETEGEMKRYMKFMGRTNWAIENVEKAKWIMAFIPGLQGGALEAEKAKQTPKKLQNLSLVPYMKKLNSLRKQGCPLDPRMLKTPFHLRGLSYERDSLERARLRSTRWTYFYLSYPYAVSVDWNAKDLNSFHPALDRSSGEKEVKSPLISSFY